MAFWKKKKKQTTAKKKTPATSPKTDSPKMKPVPEWKPTISMPTYKPPSKDVDSEVPKSRSRNPKQVPEKMTVERSSWILSENLPIVIELGIFGGIS